MKEVNIQTLTASETEESDSASQHAFNNATIYYIRTVGSLIDRSSIDSSEESGDKESV